MAATYSPSVMQVPSAMGDLTSLFGMGRGEHPRQNHHKNVNHGNKTSDNKLHIGKEMITRKKIKLTGN
jgi:hypothetical protein